MPRSRGNPINIWLESLDLQPTDYLLSECNHVYVSNDGLDESLCVDVYIERLLLLPSAPSIMEVREISDSEFSFSEP